jgi:hypothetical protein
VSSIIDELINEGWVKETTYMSDKVWRPGLLLENNPGGGFAVGIEIGVDFILAIALIFRQRSSGMSALKPIGPKAGPQSGKKPSN